MEFRRTCIVGTGLIGGSLALAFRRNGIGGRLVGIDKQSVVEKALALRMIDEGYESQSLEKGVIGADLIILATPICEIVRLLNPIAELAKQGALVTDVGSTKEHIMRSAQREFSGKAYFLGGHPMAGSEKTGLQAADAFLFENCFYVLTPAPDIPRDLVDGFAALIERIGAKVLLLDAVIHDRIAAAVSHLPQLLAVCLVNFVERLSQHQPEHLKLAAGGFRDITRVASSPYDLWKDIFETNSENIIRILDDFIEELGSFRKSFLQAGVQEEFDKAARTRLSIPRDTKGFIHPHFDIAVVVEDKPGVIAVVATTLAEKNINIRDIEVLKVRLWEAGTLRLSFETEKDRGLALSLLREKGFVCQER